MAYLLILPILIYTAGDTLDMSLSLGPGLSLKNGAMYFIGLILALRMAIKGGYKVELQTIHVCFVLMIAYAIISLLVAGLLIRYDSYKILESAIVLKSTLVDYAVIFGLYFYGTRTVKDTLLVMRAIVIAVTITNVISIAGIEGLVNIAGVDTTPGEKGRVAGQFGGANGTAALIICILPTFVAFAQSSRGIWPLLWVCGGLVSITMIMMTASRGAMLAVVLAYPVVAYSLRKYISARYIAYCVGGLVLAGAVAFAVVGPHFVALFLSRIVTESTASDVGSLSSGRSDIWLRAVMKMMQYPITLITGFGWNAYETMGFHFATHNYYLELWFELGLVGLFSFIVLSWRTIATARAAVDRAPLQSRSALIAFVFGYGAYLISLFFSSAAQPWPYVYALAGVTMRMAVLALAPASDAEHDTARAPRKSAPRRTGRARTAPVAVGRRGATGALSLHRSGPTSGGSRQ